MTAQVSTDSRRGITVQQLLELRHVLDWYDDLPPERFGDPLILAILVEESPWPLARSSNQPTSSPSDTSRVDDGAERLRVRERNAADPADAASKRSRHDKW